MPLIIRQLLMTWLPLLLGTTCVMLIPWYSYQQGLKTGRLEVRAEADKDTIDSLNNMLTSHRQLIIDANKISEQMLSFEHQRQVYDQETTNTLQEVLNETAALRTACVFGPDVMRELENARQRAAEAAAGGLDGTVPGSGGTDR